MAAESSSSSEVVYLGHIPHGFFEPQIRKYFSQFGGVRKVRLCRSKKSGKSKCYGFIKFSSALVAKAASEAMDNYLMFNKILKCKVLSKEKIPAKLFKGCDKVFTRSLWPSINASRQNRQKTPEADDRRRKRFVAKMDAKNKKLAALGIKYSYIIDSECQASTTTTEVKQEVKNEVDDADATIVDSSFTDVSYYSMHVDSSDDEICFKTPPNVVKVTKRKSVASPSTDDDKPQVVSKIRSGRK